MRAFRLYLPAAGCAVLLHAVIAVAGQGFMNLPATREPGEEAGPDLPLSLRISVAKQGPSPAAAITHAAPGAEPAYIVPENPTAESGRASPAAGSVRNLAQHYASVITGGGLYQKPRPLAEINPVYPLGARLRNEQGEVVYRVFVSATGRIERIERARTSGVEELDEAAHAALLRTGFSPAFLRGKPIAGQVLIRITFKWRKMGEYYEK